MSFRTVLSRIVKILDFWNKKTYFSRKKQSQTQNVWEISKTAVQYVRYLDVDWTPAKFQKDIYFFLLFIALHSEEGMTSFFN